MISTDRLNKENIFNAKIKRGFSILEYLNDIWYPSNNRPPMNSPKNNRRTFIKKTIAGSAALSIGGILPGSAPKVMQKYLGQMNISLRHGCQQQGQCLGAEFCHAANAEVPYL